MLYVLPQKEHWLYATENNTRKHWLCDKEWKKENPSIKPNRIESDCTPTGKWANRVSKICSARTLKEAATTAANSETEITIFQCFGKKKQKLKNRYNKSNNNNIVMSMMIQRFFIKIRLSSCLKSSWYSFLITEKDSMWILKKFAYCLVTKPYDGNTLLTYFFT